MLYRPCYDAIEHVWLRPFLLFAFVRHAGRFSGAHHVSRVNVSAHSLLLATGHVLAQNHGGVLTNDWILWSYGLFGVSGAIWVAVLLPIQFKQAKLLRESTTEIIPQAYYRLARVWSVAGAIATLFPLPAIYLMVAKGT